jgi:hypothetical protein
MNGNIQGNKRTPQRFVGREAVVTTQCLNGWLVTFLLFLTSIFACFKVWCIAQVNFILMSVALFFPLIINTFIFCGHFLLCDQEVLSDICALLILNFLAVITCIWRRFMEQNLF